MNHNELNTVKNVIEMLNNLPERDNLNTDDVLEEVKEIMKRNTILKQHKENYKVWQAKDGRWKTKLPDGSKYGKLVAKATLENLENFIVDFYKAKEETDKITIPFSNAFTNYVMKHSLTSVLLIRLGKHLLLCW